MIYLNDLPRIIELSQFGGDYRSYMGAVYTIFHRDFIQSKASFGSHVLRLKFHPKYQERAYTFYHMTHEGKDEDNRIPDFRRCERIGWAKPSIENVGRWNLKFWRQSRKGSSNRVCILLEVLDDSSYFVVLEVRKDYVLLWTAFVSSGKYKHEKRKKLEEYERWKQGAGASICTPDELIANIQAEIKS